MSAQSKIWHDIHVLSERGWIFERSLGLGENPDKALETAAAEHENAARLVRCDWEPASDYTHEVRVRSQLLGTRLTEDSLGSLRVDYELCKISWDLYEDRARNFARKLLVDFTDSNHLTVYEILHSAQYAHVADKEPMVVQNAIQRAAAAQSHHKDSTTTSRTRKLMLLRETLVTRLMEVTRMYAIPNPLEVGGMKGLRDAWSAALRESQYVDTEGGKNDSALWELMIGLSVVSGSPVNNKNWMDRIAYVASLGASKLSPVYARVLDKYMADLLSVPAALGELLNVKSQNRRDFITRACVMYSGQTRIMLRHLDPQIARAIDGMMMQPIYRRSHDVLRRRILIELSRRAAWNVESEMLSDQLQEISIVEKFVSRVPPLLKDEEIVHLLAWNYDRFTSVENLANFMSKPASPMEKLRECSKIIKTSNSSENIMRAELYAVPILREDILPMIRTAKKNELLQSVEDLIEIMGNIQPQAKISNTLIELLDKILSSLLRSRIAQLLKSDPVGLISFALKQSETAINNTRITLSELASGALQSPELNNAIRKRCKTAEQEQAMVQMLSERVKSLAGQVAQEAADNKAPDEPS